MVRCCSNCGFSGHNIRSYSNLPTNIFAEWVNRAVVEREKAENEIWKYLPEDIVVNIILPQVIKSRMIENRKLKLTRHLELKYILSKRRVYAYYGLQPGEIYGLAFGNYEVDCLWHQEGWLFKKHRPYNQIQKDRDERTFNRPLKLKNYREPIDWSGE